EFGAYTLNFELLCWINEPHNHPKIKAKINAVVFRLFKERDIQMPNPQQDIHLRSGWEQLARQSQASQGTD
ncbi:MAG TPA: hypothetical protein VLZ81_17360, partial [Blastocatellia bacterium]|nr:hypothetical protein [Blastocatellia bacterium]